MAIRSLASSFSGCINPLLKRKFNLFGAWVLDNQDLRSNGDILKGNMAHYEKENKEYYTDMLKGNIREY